VAATGILATMPYIALQLVGIQVVLEGMGIGGSGASTLERDLPLFIAFAILAAYTYQSGLRAPALIAFVKDTMIYITVLVAIVYIPAKLGGWGHIFDAAGQALPHHSPPGSLILGNKQFVAYSTLALGSALALFLYPHSITAVLSSGSRNVVRRNAAILPAYSFLLGLLALLGFMAIAAGLKPATNNLAIPQLFDRMFPDWFVGFAFAAIAIGALVPAAIMSIAAANLFTRNVYREWLRPDATPRMRRTWPGSSRWSSSLARSPSSCSSRPSTPSTCSCSAGCGSCRRCRRWCWGCTPAGSTAARCCWAGPPGSSWGPGWPGRPPSSRLPR